MSDSNNDGIFSENTARLDIKQSANENLCYLTGSGIVSKHSRTNLKRPGIDKCQRKVDLGKITVHYYWYIYCYQK